MTSNPDNLSVNIWSEKFLGNEARARCLVKIFETMDGGRWVPGKWGHFEPISLKYSPASIGAILDAIAEERNGGISNDVLFRKRQPRMLIDVESWRETVPRLNHVWLQLEAKPFSGADGPQQIKKMVLDLVSCTDAVYASVSHSRQAHRRIAQRTPIERLERIDWLNYFGKPYVDLFGGRERLTKAPCYQVEALRDGILLIAAPRPDSLEMVESARVLVGLEEYLGADCFAGRAYPHVACRVPVFDLSETIVGDQPIA